LVAKDIQVFVPVGDDRLDQTFMATVDSRCTLTAAEAFG